jgi:hypothetical protein
MPFFFDAPPEDRHRPLDDQQSPNSGEGEERVTHDRDEIARQIARDVKWRYPILSRVVSLVGSIAWVLLACGAITFVLCGFWFLGADAWNTGGAIFGMSSGLSAAISGVVLGVAAEALRTLADIAVQTMPRSLTVHNSSPKPPPPPPRSNDAHGISPDLL